MSLSGDECDDSFSGESLNEDPSSAECNTPLSNSRDDNNKNEKFVQRETQYVFFLRLGVILILLVAATAMCVTVFHVTENGEQQSFASHYEAAAAKVTDTFTYIATERMAAAGSLVVAFVAQEVSSQHNWPFVTLPAFQERAATVKRLSEALYIGMNPIVKNELRAEWESYSNYNQDAGWYQEALEYQTLRGIEVLDDRPPIKSDDPDLDLSHGIANHIYDYHRDTGDKAIISPRADYYLPIWQTSPATRTRTMINQNRASNSNASVACLETNHVVFEGMQFADPGYGDDPDPHTAEIAWLLSLTDKEETKYEGDIFTTVYFPLYNNFSATRAPMGVMRIIVHWARFFTNILPASTQGVVIVLENSCDSPYTYMLNGGKVVLVGHGDLHDPTYDQFVKTASFRDVSSIEDGTTMGLILHQNGCPYSIRVYPSADFDQDYNTKTPAIITLSVAFVFLFAVMMFFLYDRLVERRQAILLRKATQTHQIVASLFPKNVRERLLQDDSDNTKKKGLLGGPNQRLKSFLDGNDDNNMGMAPIADLFPHATVLFADIAGFTAWSSSREPAHVFLLLQSIYQAFDEIAKRHKVFKIETIGDSYVAVTGCPEPQANHAVIMVRFASQCLLRMREVTSDLEKSLGPDTGELSMRFGINSGPVTAGVLRGDKSRFQLFGDTMNTASRMESTGIAGRIQVSQITADLLLKAGKGHWVRAREDNILAKGKGVLKTYWATPHLKRGTSHSSGDESRPHEKVADSLTPLNAESVAILRHERHVDWMTELLQDKIRVIVAHHQTTKKACISPRIMSRMEGQIALDELVEVIRLPDFVAEAPAADTAQVEIQPEVVELLREYVAIIASAYRDNPFHNFEHACHVTMSVSKLLRRVVTDDLEHDQEENSGAKRLRDYINAINSDPITLFAIVFSALIHDVDHRGVSNVQLMAEEPHMAQNFRNKSIAEQNSLEISWDLLMSDRFKLLRDYIFADEDELSRFRQVIVNVVLATDIFDKELNEQRKARWTKAFSVSSSVSADKNALRATIVIEHIIQASDVCHTMQHWHIYRKWNQRLFNEMLLAHRAGRMSGDPRLFWYQGELNFFRSYVIPLAGKLKDCNVFGVSSDECLNFALRNQAEWEDRGETLVAEMIEEFNRTFQ